MDDSSANNRPYGEIPVQIDSDYISTKRNTDLFEELKQSTERHERQTCHLKKELSPDIGKANARNRATEINQGTCSPRKKPSKKQSLRVSYDSEGQPIVTPDLEQLKDNEDLFRELTLSGAQYESQKCKYIIESSQETLLPRRQIWIPKAICIMSTVPYYDFF